MAKAKTRRNSACRVTIRKRIGAVLAGRGTRLAEDVPHGETAGAAWVFGSGGNEMIRVWRLKLFPKRPRGQQKVLFQAHNNRSCTGLVQCTDGGPCAPPGSASPTRQLSGKPRRQSGVSACQAGSFQGGPSSRGGNICRRRVQKPGALRAKTAARPSPVTVQIASPPRQQSKQGAPQARP